MRLNIELKGDFNPGHFKAIDNALRSMGAASSQINVTKTNSLITFSLESDHRHYLRSTLQTIIANVQPRKTFLNGRETQAGKLLA